MSAREHYEAMAREAAEQLAKVDVLAALDAEIERAGGEAYPVGRKLIATRTAVAELIDAAREYREGTRCHVEKCIYCHERSTRLDVALARAGGAA